MSAHKSIDRICIAVIAVTLVITVIFCNGKALGLQTTAHAIGYEERLFDNSRVHSLDIVINDWDAFLETCENEEYSPCNVIIDGEAVKNVGIRGKGNTSLSSVKNMDSSRYSFKIEFDQYENGKSYHGLDKLCLNNIIQDNTYMKDYLAYTLMNDFGVDSPLCSYVYITVNGEDWGLYLAVEAIEDSFLSRNYGSSSGDLYKPDSMSFGGGGPGNGRDFSMTDFIDKNSEKSDESSDDESSEGSSERSFSPFEGGMPDFGNGEMPDFGNGEMPDFGNGGMPDFGNGEMPNFGGGMGSDDVKLKYSDDAPDSYSNIFNNAKTPATKADQKRLISALKALSEQSDLENTLDTEEVLRYFVVHNFLCNGDSYTGQMIHNYYLYEEDGQLSMIPWDYNLAFGSFSGGEASSSVNSPIDTPVSGDMSDRPMVAWIFGSKEYTDQYHELFSEFLNSVDFEKLVSDTAALIDEYVEKDPTKFCTYDEFKKGVEAISKFCQLRAESVSGQLEGSIPSTSDGQKADSSALVDTGDLNISDMGTMNNGGGFGGGPQGGGFGRREKSGDDADAEKPAAESSTVPELGGSASSVKTLSSFTLAEQSSGNDRPSPGGQPPQGFDPDNMPEGFNPGEMPEGFNPGEMPGGTAPANVPETTTGNSDAGSPDTTTEEAASQGGKPSAPSSQEQSSREGRPQKTDFPQMGENKGDNSADYILLGISSLVLLAGIGFAFLFKR